jgi:hypothetical protein
MKQKEHAITRNIQNKDIKTLQICVSATMLTVVATKGAIVEDAMLLSLIEIHGCFGGRYFLELQGRS